MSVWAEADHVQGLRMPLVNVFQDANASSNRFGVVARSVTKHRTDHVYCQIRFTNWGVFRANELEELDGAGNGTLSRC